MRNFYWFYLETYVYASQKGDNILLYNTLSGDILEYNNNIEIAKVVTRLLKNKNLFVVKLKKHDLENPILIDFVDRVRKLFMGDIFEANNSLIKPIQFKPILSIQKSIDVFKQSKDLDVGRRSMLYLTELTLSINNSCKQHCINCMGYHKQFLFCSKNSQNKHELNFSTIQQIIIALKGTAIQKMNIIGGNVLQHSEYKKIINLLLSCQLYTEINIYYKNILEDIENLHKPHKYLCLNVLVNFPIEIEHFNNIVGLLSKKNIKSKFTFVIENQNDFNEVERLSSTTNIDAYTVQPYYNKNNISFFEKNVFISKEDFVQNKISLNDTFKHKVLNEFNFGKMHISSTGEIYSNINNDPIGNINAISLNEAIYNELDHGESWLKLRIHNVPCKGCVYNLLCPSLGNYEIAIGKNNLCSINK